MPFTLGMYEDSCILTYEILGWSGLLVPLVVWDSPSIGLWVNLLQDFSGIGIVDDPVGFWLGSELSSPLWDLLDSETWPPVGLQLIVYTPYDSKVRYPDLVGSLLRATIVVPPSGFFPNFTPPPSWTFLTFTSQARLAATISGAWTTLPRRRGRSWHCNEAKYDKKVETKL